MVSVLSLPMDRQTTHQRSPRFLDYEAVHYAGHRSLISNRSQDLRKKLLA